MYKVYIDISSRTKIKDFINSYKKIFLDLYTDTGIFNEELIREQYKELSQNLSRSIYEVIQETLSTQLVLWRKESWINLYQINRKCEWFLIQIIYIENQKLQERTITNISFYKK